MKKLYSLIMIINLAVLFGQNNDQFGIQQQIDDNKPIVYREYGVSPLALEFPIDPKVYVLGPGDRLRLNFSVGIYEDEITKEWSLENIDNFITIGPTGNLFIPRVGSLDVLGMTLYELDSLVNEIATETYKSSKVSISLIRLRQFKVLVYGAINSPGFVKVAPVSRLAEVIYHGGGIQKYADPEIVILERNGTKKEIFLKEFLLSGDTDNNPLLMEGDKVYIPFYNLTEQEQKDLIEYSPNRIIVMGFVGNPRMHNYYPGFTVKDYLAMSGGTLDIGSSKRVKILRMDGTTKSFAFNEFVEPGDIISVPERYSSALFGNTGIVQAITSIATLILAYQATLQ